MYKKLIPAFLVWMAVSLACNLLTQSTVSSTTVPEVTPPLDSTAPANSNTQAKGISSESPSPHSIRLQWQPIDGAVKYLLEIKVGDEFIPVAVLPPSSTSYQDENVPPATRFTYRLSSLVNAEKRDSKEVTVETQPMPVGPIQVGIEFDKSAPVKAIDPKSLDPNNLDPNNIDPSLLDPKNFDPANFMPQPLETEAVIGPQGGQVTVTGSSGVVYTLIVPPDALRMEVSVKLRAISALSGLPLSGGLLAGVVIEPTSLVFDIPAQLSMTPPADFAVPTAPLLLAFSFDDDGQDFHLVPFKTGSGQSERSKTVASLQMVPGLNSPLSRIVDTFYGGGYGQASGTSADVNQIAQKASAKAQNRTAQELALDQLDELTPLIPLDQLTPHVSKEEIAAGKMAESIRQKAAQAEDWAKFMEAMDDFRTFLDSGGDQYGTTISTRIFELLAAKARALLKKNQGDCLTYEDYMAQDLVERLSNPKEQFSKMLSEVFKANYTQKLLDDLTYMVKSCKYELTMNSKMTFSAAGSVVTNNANFEKLNLFPIFSKGEIFLWGGGKMQLSDAVSGICTFPLNHYPDLKFMVEKMVPVFENGLLVDFVMKRYGVQGWNAMHKITAQQRSDGCPSLITLSGGGDFWTGLFTIARIDDPIYDWKITNNLKSGGSLTASWKSARPSFVPMGISEAVVTETTTFDLKVTKNKK